MIDLTTCGFYTSDEVKLTYYETPCPAKPKGIVLIVHGMAEHASRYHEFMDFLYNNNYLAVAHDQRGHGLTGKRTGELGFFASDNGWERVVSDVRELSLSFKEAYPHLPLFIIGHSMGSVVTRHAVIAYPQLYQGAVIIGTTIGINKLMRKTARLIAEREIKKHGEKTPSHLLSTLSFGSYNKKFKTNRTSYDWLSLSKTNVDQYITDPLCGFTCSAGFYRDLFYGLDFTTKAANIKKIPRDFPLLFLSGRDDPVGGMGKEVNHYVTQLKKTGHRSSELILYPLMRHEILFEDNHELVFQDILRFLNTRSIS
ncbi:alpha/beta fold hydrolase [Acetobacterium woodii]|uniref:Lysophospholipase L2 n=1 Tax=Acetobacterium woodii (strain ATCC 29683 / DSM 1030 / JCM 2381 / KCTC 1655 / WB1) TaxID=931626 RepID=H6LHA1_ACEWD|nr:alpha/beta fold hydrolase [Acetobacterium woodii]AFA48439.1 lysophospholipase L2 [Acetobacterium woodii DSM 1030]